MAPAAHRPCTNMARWCPRNFPLTVVAVATYRETRNRDLDADDALAVPAATPAAP